MHVLSRNWKSQTQHPGSLEGRSFVYITALQYLSHIKFSVDSCYLKFNKYIIWIVKTDFGHRIYPFRYGWNFKVILHHLGFFLEFRVSDKIEEMEKD